MFWLLCFNVVCSLCAKHTVTVNFIIQLNCAHLFYSIHVLFNSCDKCMSLLSSELWLISRPKQTHSHIMRRILSRDTRLGSFDLKNKNRRIENNSVESILGIRNRTPIQIFRNRTAIGIQSASEWRKPRYFSNGSSERFWLVITFICSTASCVIGYNAVQARLSLAQCQTANADLNLAADNMTHWTL